MTILEKLHAIEQAKVIYDIHYCMAGIGFIFFYPERIGVGQEQQWQRGLSVQRYYPSFEEAVEAEYTALETGGK